ncbi:MAG: cell division protein FtsL [Granulosicoccus sp.]
MSRYAFSLVVVAALCFCTAIAVAYSKHLSIQAYVELSRNQRTVNALDVQWSQLQIEESTFSEHGLVERTATDRLGMVFPGLDGSVMIVR